MPCLKGLWLAPAECCSIGNGPTVAKNQKLYFFVISPDLKTFAVFDLKTYIPICSMCQTKPVYTLSFLWVWLVIFWSQSAC